MGFRDRVLEKVGDKIEEEKKEKAEKISVTRTKVHKEVVQGQVQEIKVQTEFKSVRHLVEYLLIKNKEVKFNHTELVVKKMFPGQMYDAGLFMMVKLQIIREKYLMYREELIKQIPEAFNDSTSDRKMEQ